MGLIKFKYQFDTSTGIVYKFYYGEITIEDINSSWEYAFENNLIPKETKGFILDYRRATFKIEIDNHIKIADFYRTHIDIFKDYKIGIITEKPVDIVIPILVATKDDGYESKPFSTVEAAIKWVLQ